MTFCRQKGHPDCTFVIGGNPCDGDPIGPSGVVSLSQCVTPAPSGPGPVERGVQAEIAGPGAEGRPGLAQAALAMARILDNRKAVNQQASAARKLAMLLDRLHSVSARGRRGSLTLVRDMSKKGGGA